MFTALVIFHVIVCILLILVVLMQSSKGDGLAGAAFGGSVGGAVFGGRGTASILSKATTVLAIVFMLNCGALAFMSSSGRTPAQGGATPGESSITRQAQEERDRMIQQQQEQAQKAGADTANPPVQILDAPPATDTGN